jgi:hypothetical protein
MVESREQMQERIERQGLTIGSEGEIHEKKKT